MTRSVDVVIVGANAAAAMAATLDAIGRGLRVLVVIRLERLGLARRLRQAIRRAGRVAPRQLTVLTGVEVVCVDGVKAIEAVVVRHVRTGRLVAFNASAVVNTPGHA
ncbi:MAG: hypothetical protein Q8L75_07910 [Acidobacteriota bacterium]|nr:hypothetical protein [Acidobacteriota bacterium]